MSNKPLVSEILIAVSFVALLTALLNPWGAFMPMPLVMTLLVFLLVAFGIFAGLIWRERGGDERDRFHAMLADRVAYLLGTGVLLVGVAIQSFTHALDPWLVVVLGIMIIAKIAGRILTRWKY